VIVDSSAIMAVFRREDDAEAIAKAMRLTVSPGPLSEIGMVTESRGGPQVRKAAELLLFKGDDFAQTDVKRAL
jgi:uncharacterized protein with PIN domain